MPPPPPPQKNSIRARLAAVPIAGLAIFCLAAIATSQETGMVTSSINTGTAGSEWNHTFFWPRGIERIYTYGANGLAAPLNFRAELTSAAGRTQEKTQCKRQIEDPVVKALGGRALIWEFVDYDPENGVTCDASERIKRTTSRPDLGPKTCRTTTTLIDCRGLSAADLPDEVSYRVSFPDPVTSFNNLLILYIHVKGENTARQIRYIAGGCDWYTCP